MHEFSATNLFFSVVAHECSDTMYCRNCKWSNYCFGCIWLVNQKYCIFNKQYTKDEYEKEVAKVITRMQATWERWHFLDPIVSPFSYNVTLAQETYPLTKEEALARWCKRQDKEYPINVPEGIEKIDASELPKEIGQVDDTVLDKALICEVSGKPFRIIKPELEFYRKHALPLPTKHPDVRHQERIAKRPGRELYLRTCDKTWEEILSVYPQSVPFEVYSQSAYEKEVYG